MQKITNQISIQQSELWQTNTGIVHGPEGALLIDPGIFPDEMNKIAGIAGHIAAGFATHSHWDHVLWDASFGADTPRFAVAETVANMQADPDRILRNLSNAEQEFDKCTLWDRGLLFREQALSWGPGEIAGIRIELMPVPGHADGQAALVLPDHGVAFVADTLSDIEIPSISSGARSIATYVQTLDRLRKVIDRVEWIVPGHGSPANREEARQRLDADRRYLEALKPAVESGVGESVEAIAARLLIDLDEQRAESVLAASMHVDNVRQLVEERDRLASDIPVRKSSRVILMDHDNRVWMLRINDPTRPRWILPGGGVEEGETPEQAARRELWEECGINDAEIGPMVGIRRALSRIKGGEYHIAQEQYFVVRLNGQMPHGDNMLPHEVDDYTQQAWFSVDEMRASYEQIYPIGLANLVDLLARGEYPSEPWQWLD